MLTDLKLPRLLIVMKASWEMEHSGSVLWSSDYTSGCIDTKINTKTASRNQNKISNHATFRWRERFNAVRRSVYKLDHSVVV